MNGESEDRVRRAERQEVARIVLGSLLAGLLLALFTLEVFGGGLL